MRDSRFIAEHRGGPLKREQHIQLILWSCECVEHVLPLFAGTADNRLINALQTARAWAESKTSVGDARKASVAAIALARESTDQVEIALARAAGHAVATAHMADHSLGGAIYALKAIKFANKSVEAERKWQNDRLSTDIRDLIMSSRTAKGQAFKDLRI
jgi:phosphoglycerate dehydrogenase-like enzyme